MPRVPALAPALALLALALSPPARAQKPPAPAPLAVNLPLSRVTLDNGLRVVMNVDHASPTVAVALTYDVGARDEAPGRTGFAHLFEHLMFGATKNLEKGEFDRLVVGRGGFSTAIIDHDRTAYYMVVPENELDLALWLEAERMQHLKVDAAAFEAERKVVEEEHRLRIGNDAHGTSRVRLDELVFEGSFPYAHPLAGEMADLQKADIAWVKQFHDAHYGPNTAVLSLSGDLDTDAAMALVHRYFDGIPRVAQPTFQAPALPAQTAERRAVVDDPIARTPALFLGFALPERHTPERDALEFLAVILGDGESARLPAKLVREEGLAIKAEAAVDTTRGRGPGMLRIEIELADKAAVADVEKRVDEALADIGSKAPSEAEMARARRRIEATFARGLAWNRDRAIEIGKYELFFGDARQITREMQSLSAVTAEDVKKAAARWLVKERRSVVVAQPRLAATGEAK
jgi:predicted Zn-dependent peptidase